MRITRRRAASCSLALLAAGAAVASACSGSSKKSATPTAAATEEVFGGTAVRRATATPTPAPPDPKLAERLRYEGDFRGASAVYASIAARASGDEQQEARLAEAQMLVRTQQPAEARAVLEAYLQDAGAAADGSAAQYMLASVLDDLGDMAGAIEGYDRYIAGNGAAAEIARLERAKLLARSGRGPEAEQAAQAVLASSLLPEFKTSFTFSMGKAYEQGHADASALAWYERVRTSGGDVASASARIGAIKKRAGDATWADEYVQAIARFPSAAVAPDLLDELDAAGVPVSDYVRGVVDYRAGRNDAARQALTRAVADGDNAAEATYYLAALDERAEDDARAIIDYGRSYEINPTSTLADDALWWRARLLERAGRLDEAGAAYEALVRDFPSSKRHADAEFRRGLVLYRSGNYAGAALTWSAIVAGTSNEVEDVLRARFWQGRAQVAAGDEVGATVLRQLAEDSEAAGDFYALRAEVLLHQNITKEKTAKLSARQPGWDTIRDYVTGATGSDPSAADEAVPEDPRWALGAELEAVGLTSQADTVFRSMLRDNSGNDIGALYRMTRRFEREGRTGLAARAATTLIAHLRKTDTPPPDDLFRIAYPPAYGDLAGDAAKKEGVSPLLLLSLVRQESFYDADAGSVAGALGLTQVVPATGESIAERLGVEGFEPEQLFGAKVSLEFGASYLASQLQSSDGNAYRALAAYNGGPGAAASAGETSGGDDDLFIEDLEFDETKLYVRLVMENLARYRQLYEGLGRPSLPE
jgi:soluble lytic murein transglycosylase